MLVRFVTIALLAVRMAAATENVGAAEPPDRELAGPYREKGDAALATGAWDDAIAAFDKAVKLDPNDARTFTCRGNAYFGKHDYSRANRDFDRALKLCHDERELEGYIHGVRALAREAVGDPDGALTDLNRAIELNDKDVGARMNRGGLWGRRRAWDKAIADFDSVLRRDPTNAAALYDRAYAYRSKGDLDRAAADLDEAILAQRGNGIAAAKDSAFFNQSGTGIRKASLLEASLLERAIIWLAKEEWKKCIADCDAVIKINPESIDAHANRGHAWAKQGKFDKAITDWSVVVRLSPKKADAFYSRGYYAQTKGDLETAIADFTQAIRLDSQSAAYYLARGATWLRKREWDNCIADTSAALRIDSKQAVALAYRGAAWAAKANWARALADYTRALEIEPNGVLALSDRALLFASCPDAKYRDSTRALRDAKQLCRAEEPTQPNDYFVLAAAYAEAGQFDEAVKWQKKALADERYRTLVGRRGEKILQLFEENKPYRMDMAD